MSQAHVFIFSCHNSLHVTSSFIFFNYKNLTLHSLFATPFSSTLSSMAYKALLIAFFVLFSTSLARQQQHQQQQQQNVCQLRNIEALEPYYTIQAEAGVSEIWDSNNQQFQCAGVDFVRHRIQAGGLFLPSYVNTPLLVFVERGTNISCLFKISMKK